MKPAPARRKPDPRSLFLAVVAVVCAAQALACALSFEAVNASNWFGGAFVATGFLALRECLRAVR